MRDGLKIVPMYGLSRIATDQLYARFQYSTVAGTVRVELACQDEFHLIAPSRDVIENWYW